MSSTLDDFQRGSREVAQQLRLLKTQVRELQQHRVEVVEERGDYVEAKTLEEAELLARTGKAILINRPIVAKQGVYLESHQPLQFGPQGMIMFNAPRARVTLDLPVINPGNKRIFFDEGAPLVEDYPNRWSGPLLGVAGTFGGTNIRDPRWWGLITHRATQQSVASQRRVNVQAIHLAAQSRPFISGAAQPVIVQLPAGRIAQQHGIRLDGLKATLRGAGMGATILWGDGPWEFQHEDGIRTEHFDETVPMVELGYRRQGSGPNPDEGFMSRVDDLSIVCPLTPRKPITGVLIGESGWQEGGGMKNVGISNYSGYAVGAPKWQRLSHNGADQGYYSQRNTVSMEGLWIVTPNAKFPGAIGVNMFGLNWSLRDSTIHHHSPGGYVNGPALICGARECGKVEQVHIEHKPQKDEVSPCVLLPNDGEASRMHFDGIYGWLAGNLAPGVISETIRNENPNASLTCHNVNHRTGTTEPLNQNTICIHDVPRGKKSDGQWKPYSSKCVASYARQRPHGQNGQVTVVTTDPSLE